MCWTNTHAHSFPLSVTEAKHNALFWWWKFSCNCQAIHNRKTKDNYFFLNRSKSHQLNASTVLSATMIHSFSSKMNEMQARALQRPSIPLLPRWTTTTELVHSRPPPPLRRTGPTVPSTSRAHSIKHLRARAPTFPDVRARSRQFRRNDRQERKRALLPICIRDRVPYLILTHNIHL